MFQAPTPMTTKMTIKPRHPGGRTCAGNVAVALVVTLAILMVVWNS